MASSPARKRPTTTATTPPKATKKAARTALTPQQREAAAAAQQQRLSELLDRLDGQVRAIRTGAQWTAWLRCAAKFHSYSFNNTMAIWAQRPDATQVAGYQTWQSMGRQVVKGEKGIAILAPILRSRRTATPADGDTGSADAAAVTASAGGPGPADELEPGAGRPVVTGVTRVHVFDVSQTEGDPLPEQPRPALLPGQAPEGLWDGLAAQVAAAGYDLRRGPCGTANGVTHFTDRTVTVSDRLVDGADGQPGAQACKTLAHELAHVLLHAPTAGPDEGTSSGMPAGISGGFCRGDAEVEAESVAFLVASQCGLATDDYSFAYVAGWLEAPGPAGLGLLDQLDPADTIRRCGTRILSTAHSVLDQMAARDTAALSTDLKVLRERATNGADRTAVAVSVGTAGAADASTPAPTPSTSSTSRVPELTEAQLAQVRAVLADTQAFFTAAYPDSWASLYLESRFGIDVALDPAYGFGMAPPGWTTLTDHLRSLGHPDGALEAAGVCSRTRRGTLVDRFRDRVTLPLHDPAGRPVSFTARLNPDPAPTTRKAGPAAEAPRTPQPPPPKYLNGPATALFDKGAQLYGPYAGPGHDAAARGARVVLVEGGFDAVAVTAGTGGRAVGVAPCGTALTDRQADQVAALARASGRPAVVATDADLAGYVAAERAYLALAGRGKGGAETRAAALPAGSDPASLLHSGGGYALVDAIENGPRLADVVVDRRLSSREPFEHIPAMLAAARYAAGAAAIDDVLHWFDHVDVISARTTIDPSTVHEVIVQASAAAFMAQHDIPSTPPVPPTPREDRGSSADTGQQQRAAVASEGLTTHLTRLRRTPITTPALDPGTTGTTGAETTSLGRRNTLSS